MNPDVEHHQCTRCGQWVKLHNRLPIEKRETFVCSWCQRKHARTEYDERRRLAELPALTEADWDANQAEQEAELDAWVEEEFAHDEPDEPHDHSIDLGPDEPDDY